MKLTKRKFGKQEKKVLGFYMCWVSLWFVSYFFEMFCSCDTCFVVFFVLFLIRNDNYFG